MYQNTYTHTNIYIYIYEKNDFAEESKILLDTNLKIILEP